MPDKPKILVYPQKLELSYGTPASSGNVIQFSLVKYTNVFSGDKLEGSAKINTNIFLELPKEMSLPENHEWGGADLLTQSRVSDAGSLLKASAGIGANVLKDMLKGTIDQFAGSYAQGAIDQFEFNQGQTRKNPNTTLIYKNSGIRDFVLNFVFQPENKSEAKIVKEIINVFKEGSRATDNGTASGLIFPDVWKIKPGSAYLRDLLDMNDKTAYPFALSGFTPTYDSNIMYENEYPSSILLMLTFKEIRPRFFNAKTSSLNQGEQNTKDIEANIKKNQDATNETTTEG